MARTNLQIERRIEAIKRELSELGEPRPGSLSMQYSVCGTPNCQCKASPPKKHGPYAQLSFTRKGRGTTRFVREGDVPKVKRQLKNYANLRRLVDEWIDLSTELCVRQLKAGRKPTPGK